MPKPINAPLATRAPRRTKALTDLECRNAKPLPKPYKLSDGSGLSLLVMPTSKKYWRQRFLFGGQEYQIAFGTYPEVSLNEARERRAEARKLLRDGINPAALRKEQRQLAKLRDNGDTFRELAEAWFKLKAPGWSKRHGENIMSRLRNDAFPLFGDVTVRHIRPSHLRELVEKIQDRGANDIARRTLQYCGQIFVYAHAYDKIDANPAMGLTKLLGKAPKRNFPALTSDQLPEFLGKLYDPGAPMTHQTRLATQLLMLTFLRTKELVEAPWSEISFETSRWIIPAERMKKRRDHIVPLSTQALAILHRLKAMAGKSEWVFPSRSRARQPMSNGTILGAIKALGYNGQMTGHGFRALAMTTIIETLNHPHHIVDRQLAHKPTAANAPYNRAEYIADRTKMMQDWADYIDRIEPESLNGRS